MTEGKIASIRDRLYQQARAGEEFELVLTRYALERFLYRLSVSKEAEQFCLKGALLFDLWFDNPHRPTRDADFLGTGSDDETYISNCMREVCAIECDDGMSFDPDSVNVQPIRDETGYGGLRIRLVGYLGKIRSSVQVDIGYGDIVTPEAEYANLPTRINDMPAPRFKTYSQETVIAEKLEAIVKLGIRNSRMKDYYDLCILLQRGNVDRKVLPEAIEATFKRRGTELPTAIPVGLQDEFSANSGKQRQWRAFVDRNRLEAPGLDDIIRLLRAGLSEPLIKS